MVEKSAKEDWVRTLTERSLDREEQPWDVQVVGESGFTLLELVATEYGPHPNKATRASALHREPPFDVLTNFSLVSQLNIK